MSERYDICSSVVGHLPYDARVWKEVDSLAAAGYRVKLIGNRYDIDSALRYNERGVDVVEFPFGPRSGETPRGVREKSVLRLWKEAVDTDARVFHAHNIHTFPAMLAAARRRNARLVYDGHELYGQPRSSRIQDRAKGRVLRLVEKAAVLRADAVITTNRSRVQVLSERHGRSGLIHLANVPKRVDRLDPIDPGFPADVPVLLYQGGVYAEDRAFRETIAALAKVPDVHLVVLGFGRDRDLGLIDTWAEESGVSDRVHRLGPRPFDELVHTAASADIGLVPLKPVSLNSWLGDTNKLHEYLMAGVPVVASGFPEVVAVTQEGDPPVGETFDPEDPESIANAIRAILDDPRQPERRSEARRIALEKHNWENEASKLLDLYKSMIGPAKSPSIGEKV